MFMSWEGRVRKVLDEEQEGQDEVFLVLPSYWFATKASQHLAKKTFQKISHPACFHYRSVVSIVPCSMKSSLNWKEKSFEDVRNLSVEIQIENGESERERKKVRDSERKLENARKRERACEKVRTREHERRENVRMWDETEK